jgi:hypothetical protein
MVPIHHKPSGRFRAADADGVLLSAKIPVSKRAIPTGDPFFEKQVFDPDFC